MEKDLYERAFHAGMSSSVLEHFKAQGWDVLAAEVEKIEAAKKTAEHKAAEPTIGEHS